MTEREQFLQQNGDLDAVRRGERIELQRMAANRQRLVVRGAGNGAVDVLELAAALLGPRFSAACRRVGRSSGLTS
jgi:hypothetical protein